VICEPWDVVVVPFPFTDSPETKRRPALVLSRREFNRDAGHSLLAQITTARQSAWPADVTFDHGKAGLREPSIVRMKLFTLDNRLILKKVGSLVGSDRAEVTNSLARLMPAKVT
jgi:mRNA interferase MazF